MITPESVAKADEGSQQLALFVWLSGEARTRPIFGLAFHVPNGDSRGDTELSRSIAGGRLKGQGVKSGVPDVAFPVARRGYHGLFIEMKRPGLRPKGPKSPRGTSDKQDRWIAALMAQGNCVAICYEWTEARDVFLWYLNGD